MTADQSAVTISQPGFVRNLPLVGHRESVAHLDDRMTTLADFRDAPLEWHQMATGTPDSIIRNGGADAA